MRRALSTIVICAVLLGCKIRKRQPESEPETKDTSMSTSSTPSSLTPEQLAELRAEVIARSTLFDRPELTPTDPAIVDPCITGALPEGRFPATPKEREDLLWSAKTCLTNWLSYKPDGLAYFTKRIEERYANPVITRDGDLVRIDAGVVAGTPGLWKAKLQIMKSPHLEQGELIATEVVRLVKLGIAKHADAKAYQVEVDIPATWSKNAWTYRYDRAEDRIRMYADNWPSKYYVSETLGGSLDKLTSMYHTRLTEQPMDQAPIRSAQLPQDKR